MNRVAAHNWRGPAPWMALVVLVFLALPSLIVVPLSFSDDTMMRFPPKAWSLRWYCEFFASEAWRAAMLRSLFAAAGATVLATVIGVTAALALRHGTGAWRQAARLLILAPILVPGVLFGIGVLFMYARLGLNNTLGGLVLVHAAIGLPFVVVLVEAGVVQLDSTLETAASSLGASPIHVLRTVTLPLLRPSILSAALFAFLASFDEISVAYFISSGEYATLPRRMFSALRDSIDPTIAAVSSLLIMVTTVLIVLSFLFGAGAQPGETSRKRR